MRDRKIPCIIIVPKEIIKDDIWNDDFEYWLKRDGIKRFYFGDKMEPGELKIQG